MSGFDITRLRGYVKRNLVDAEPERAYVDLTCPFLDELRNCKVYPARPEICRVYRCDKHARGVMMDPFAFKGMKIVDLRNVFWS